MTRDVESIEINRRVREANNVEIILPGEMIMTIMDGYFIYDEIVRGIFFFFFLFLFWEATRLVLPGEHVNLTREEVVADRKTKVVWMRVS